MDYTEDQIMDNLIRAKNRYPILHLDLSTIGSVVESNLGGKASGGQSILNTGLATAVTRPFTFDISPQRNNKLSVNTQPVLNANEVYAAYEAFVDLKGSIQVGRPSDPTKVHIGRRWRDGMYYWVPREFSEEFFQMSLRVAVKRGELKGNTKTFSSTKPKVSRKQVPKALESPDVTPDAVRALESGSTPIQTKTLERLLLQVE